MQVFTILNSVFLAAVEAGNIAVSKVTDIPAGVLVPD